MEGTPDWLLDWGLCSGRTVNWVEFELSHEVAAISKKPGSCRTKSEFLRQKALGQLEKSGRLEKSLDFW
jgi:hypothetical protein